MQDELAELEKKEKDNLPPESSGVKTFAQLAANGFGSPEATKIKEKIRRIDKEIADNAEQHKKLVAIANKGLLLTRREVIAEFSKISGISANKLDEDEVQNLIRLESNLLSRIFGQDEVVRHVANSIKVAKVDTLEEAGPAVSYLFLGPSGVGKTEMAKALAQLCSGMKNPWSDSTCPNTWKSTRWPNLSARLRGMKALRPGAS